MGRPLLWLGMAGALGGLPAASPAAPADQPPRFGTVSVGLAGGFQTWGLGSLEETLDDRARLFAQNGYELEGGSFGATYAYAADFQVRLTEMWFLRAQLEWTRLKWDDRDREFLGSLGSSSRTPISVAYESKVQTRPLLLGIGPCAAREFRSIRVGVAASALVAPLRLTDRMLVSVVESITETELVSSGTGVGFELDASVDYLTDVQTTLYLEAFWRTGSTTVKLEDDARETDVFPEERRVDLDGIGIRLGLRWI
ncbi:MAG: hypothetical protein ACT4PE_15855 [Candidatus Eiseniibacteriota bacterium]